MSIAEQDKTLRLKNWIDGREIESQESNYLSVTNPSNEEIISEVPLSTHKDLDQIVSCAAKAQKSWGRTTVKQRMHVLYNLKQKLEENMEELAEIVSFECGKTVGEAKGGILRGIECIEFACSLPQLMAAPSLEVSEGIECRQNYSPLGVVAGITPFNFPLMVPLWMAPLSLGCGNAFILKPSEQTPLSAMILAKLFKESGLPDGLFSIVHGGREIVEALCDHERISAIGFVGSSKVAKAVRVRGVSCGKRVRALGGAKNHLIVTQDADVEMTASNVVASATGCCGQRCMAASVLLTVGDVGAVLERIVEKMREIIPGETMGPMISKEARDRALGYLTRAKARGCKILVDGREEFSLPEKGFFIAPSLVECCDAKDEMAQDEIFAPILTLIRCSSLEEALEIENNCPYGNAASLYTSSGKAAQKFISEAQSGMLGVNVGVPVPREPFPFGGWNASSFGEGDLTGLPGVEFWTQTKKVTMKWASPQNQSWMS
jgi:malonate-semialdehyde dehydrogenase (acetylating) / methylmalonate-semialdehyde dehydrogenase